MVVKINSFTFLIDALNESWLLLLATNGHMYEMFGDCGLRNCLPLRKLIRGRMLQVTTQSPNILYMMLPPGWYFFPKSKVIGNCFIGSTFITRFKQGSFQEIQNTLL